MKKLLYLLILLVISNFTLANNLPEAIAKNVGLNFLRSQLPNNEKSITIADIHLVQAEKISSSNAAFYIFAGTDNKGFVIVSGDDAVAPILGYSMESNMDITNPPPAFKKWMENNKDQIMYAKAHHLTASVEIKNYWNDLVNNNISIEKSVNVVTQLCSTTWNQEPYYNDLCPYDAASSQLTVTGCVATAMAQIMKFWTFPAQGSGIHSYTDATYGSQSANFGSTTYNWAGMPNNVSATNNAVATLMYHCGVSVDMNYGIGSTGGSSAFVITADNPVCAQSAYTTYFGYDPATIQGLRRSSYSDATWKALLKADLDAGRPIQYAGFGSGGGHTFVCDGYDISNNFHMNWGWGGIDNGYFDIDALNPGTLGTGGGTGGFNSNQQAVTGIKPSAIIPTGTGLALNSSITITPNPVGWYQTFNVNVDIVNNGSSTFNGDYTAALFDASNTFVAYIQTYTGNTLPPGNHYTGGLNFNTAGILTVQGNYTVGIFYEDTGGTWSLMDAGSYTNLVPLTIQGPANPDNIETYTPITPNPVDFVQGQSASVDVNLANYGASTYFGTYSVDLYDLSGNYVETVGQYTESSGLSSLSAYTVPITFSSPGISAAPGTYYLAVSEYPSGGTQWYLAGGTSNPNPVYVNVIAAGLSPDIYEVNNTSGTAYALPVTFAGSTAIVSTTGSNNHIGTDYDYYKINLPAGFVYTITARVNDSYNSVDGNTYTNDVLWSYDSGSGSSASFDDVMPGNIVVVGAGTVTFFVAPYFSGTTGTYILDMTIVRSATVGINESDETLTANFYPNPASDNILFSLNQSDCKISRIDIYNNIGQLVKSQTNCDTHTIDISNLQQGIYFVSVTTDKGIVKSKFNVVK